MRSTKKAHLLSPNVLTYVTAKNELLTQLIAKLRRFLTFGELGCLTRLMQSILLTLFRSGVARKIAFLLKDCSVCLAVRYAKRSCNAVTDCARLSRISAAADVYVDVKLVGSVCSYKGLIYDELHRIEGGNTPRAYAC